jgi:hypothetical protein
MALFSYLKQRGRLLCAVDVYRRISESVNQEYSSRFSQIAGKMLLGDPRKGTFEMRADESYPTEGERKIIGNWANAVTECARLGDTFRQANYPPQIISLLDEGEFTLLELTVDLYNQKITYGTFNRGRQSLANAVKATATEIVQRLQAEHQARKDAQAALRAQERAEREAQRRADIRADQERLAQDDAMRRQAALQILMQMRSNVPQPIKIPPIGARSITQCDGDRLGGFTCRTY